MNYFKPITQNFEPISPPDEEECWWEKYKPSQDEITKAEDMFRDFKYELAEMCGFDTEDWDYDDFNTLFEMLI